MFKLYSLIIIFILLLSIFSPVAAFAQITPSPQIDAGCVPSELGCIPTNATGFVQQYYKFGLSLIGGLALLFIIIGSYIILTSKGNPQQLNNGKSYIAYAIVGLLLAIFGFLFTEVITRDILHIPGFS